MDSSSYISSSLELHLFFSRIMKEHAFFLRAGFTPAAPAWGEKAAFFQQEFESLLCEAVTLSNGIPGKDVLTSGELITEYTTLAEQQSEQLTAIPIDRDITCRMLKLNYRSGICGRSPLLCSKVRRLNRIALKLLDGLIDFKENILQCVRQGELFTLNYPLLIEHILREAKHYRKFLEILERDGHLSERCMKDTECFWNQIMMEHAMFIRGLLDPCETELFESADRFADEFCKLLNASRSAHNQSLTQATLEQTLKLRDFKAAGTQGIQQCKIRSIILPLLADHVLREANHYIRLLQS